MSRLLTGLISIISFLFLFSSSSVYAQSSSSTGNINILLGAKALDEDDWEPVDEHAEFAIKFDFRPASWPVNLAIDLRGSASDEETFFDPFFGTIEVEAETTEWNFGVRKIWEDYHLVRPFIGGGLSLGRAEMTVTIPGVGSASESDSGIGIWIGGGVYWTLAEHFNLGLELMISTIDIEIAGVDTDAGGGHFGFLAGYHW